MAVKIPFTTSAAIRSALHRLFALFGAFDDFIMRYRRVVVVTWRGVGYCGLYVTNKKHILLWSGGFGVVAGMSRKVMKGTI